MFSMFIPKFNLPSVPAFISNNKKGILLVLVGLALFGGGYGTGRITTPSKVLTKEHVVTQIQEKVVYQDKIVEKKVYVQVEKKKEHIETTTEKKPDGTVLTKTTTDTNTDQSTSDVEDKTQEKIVYKDKVVYQDRTVTKLVESKKLDWRVGAGVGLSIPKFLGQSEIGVPGLNGAVIQVELDRRVVGPFWLGVSGTTQGTVGLNLSGVF